MNAFHRHALSNSVNSADAESHHGTPETRSTALSPEDLQSSQCSTTQSTSQSNQPPIFTLGAVPAKGFLKGRAIEMKIASYQDPFVTISPDPVASRPKEPPKLSPIAPTFTPLGLVETTSGNIVSHTLTPTKFRSLKGLVLDNLSLTETFYVSFTDIRDAIESITALRRHCANWLVQYNLLPLHGLHYQEACGTNVVIGDCEGQLLVQANFSGPPMYFDLGTVSRLILDMLNNYGDIMAYDAVITVYPLVVYRVEFFDTKDAERAITHLHGFRLAVRRLLVFEETQIIADVSRGVRSKLTVTEGNDLSSSAKKTLVSTAVVFRRAWKTTPQPG
ncbi:MAG: hypothetical protein Q9210_003281 [Variospora velana]